MKYLLLLLLLLGSIFYSTCYSQQIRQQKYVLEKQDSLHLLRFGKMQKKIRNLNLITTGYTDKKNEPLIYKEMRDSMIAINDNFMLNRLARHSNNSTIKAYAFWSLAAKNDTISVEMLITKFAKDTSTIIIIDNGKSKINMDLFDFAIHVIQKKSNYFDDCFKIKKRRIKELLAIRKEL